MKNNFTFKIISLGLILFMIPFSFTSCCRKCCSPSIEVGVSDPGQISHYCKNIEIWTWDPITKFPRNPNKLVPGSKLQPLRPYLVKANVINYSDVDVRGVTVAFYWASFGLFDRGTPIGAVAVDLPANSSKWVSSPWSFTLGENRLYHLCFSMRIFHPCDKELENNYCWRNFTIVVLPWPWRIYAIPFVADFVKIDGNLPLKIETPDGIHARVVSDSLHRGPIDTLEEIKTIEELIVKQGEPRQLSLVIENVGADLKPGDTFDVTVATMQAKQEISSFIVHFQVGETR